MQIWAIVLLLSESSVIINDLDVILHGIMLQIIYTTVFPLIVYRFNSEIRGINITKQYNCTCSTNIHNK